jgi:hypothetical protein
LPQCSFLCCGQLGQGDAFVLIRLAIGACVGFPGGFLGHAREVFDEMYVRQREALLV